MLRSIMGVVVGVIAAVVVVGVIETAGHLLFPPPAGVDLKDPAQFRTLMEKVPFAAKAAVLVAWFAGAFAGAWVAIVIAARQALAGWIVALVMLAFGGWTMTQVPHPVWMMAAGVALPVLGGWLAARLFAKPPAA